LALVILAAANIGTAYGQVSIGVLVGEPTGLGLKFGAGSSSLDLAAAWSFIEQEDETGTAVDVGAAYLHLDYQQYFDLINLPAGRLPLFAGFGGKVYLGSGTFGLGLRIPLGVTYIFASAPLEIFFEFAPGLELYPNSSFDGGAVLGFLYGL